MLRLLKILWPALIPLLIYAGWCIVRYRKKKRGEEVGPITKGLFLAVLSSLVVAVLCFVLLGAEQKGTGARAYTPTHVQDGVLVPGSFK